MVSTAGWACTSPRYFFKHHYSAHDSSVNQVRSCGLDSWSQAQIDFVASRGNVKCNQIFLAAVPSNHVLPSESSPPEVLEQWIRAKYEHKQFMTPGEPGALAEQPPASRVSESVADQLPDPQSAVLPDTQSNLSHTPYTAPAAPAAPSTESSTADSELQPPEKDAIGVPETQDAFAQMQRLVESRMSQLELKVDTRLDRLEQKMDLILQAVLQSQGQTTQTTSDVATQ